MTYRGYIKYTAFDTESHIEKSVEFDNVADATKWLSKRFAYLMLNWASIDENGIAVYGEIYSKDDNFCNNYRLECGR